MNTWAARMKPADRQRAADSHTRRAASSDGRENAARPGVAVLRSACACGGTCPRCSGGQALDGALRRRLEPRLGADLGDVRVHTDAAAAKAAEAEAAHAFTLGSHIWFAAGRFAPHTSDGAVRLAHELVHVQQQRQGLRADGRSGAGAAESEARSLGAAAAAGARVQVRSRAPLAVQRDDVEPAGGRLHLRPSTKPQLHLDPEIERMMLRQFIRWWLGSTLVDDSPPTEPPPPTETLRPDFFTPLPRDSRWVSPDYSSLYGDFNLRNIAPAERIHDSGTVMGIYGRNLALARALPDLREWAPGPIRKLIPKTWRRDVASALTSAATSASLKREYMTPLEIADKSIESMTGVSTTVIPLPGLHFDFP